jgi:hypothetical protein
MGKVRVTLRARFSRWLNPTTMSLALALAVLFPALVAAVVLLFRPQCNTRSVAIVVLGDVGRSPRIMYHAASFLRHGYRVHLVGHSGSSLIPSLQHKHVHFHPLPLAPSFFARLPRVLFILLAPIKLAWGAITLFLALLAAGKTRYVLVQVSTLAFIYSRSRLIRLLRIHHRFRRFQSFNWLSSFYAPSSSSTGTTQGSLFLVCGWATTTPLPSLPAGVPPF